MFTRIHFHFILTGKTLNSAQVETSNQALRGKILLGLNNAGKNGGTDTRLRHRGGMTVAGNEGTYGNVLGLLFIPSTHVLVITVDPSFIISFTGAGNSTPP